MKPDYSNLERVVPGPEYPVVPGRVARADRIANRLFIAAVIIVALLIAAASQRGPENNSSAESVEREGTAPALAGTPHAHPPLLAAARVSEGQGAASQATRYRGTATWYCLSGSSACTKGYTGSDLVAAIDTDLGFGKGDRLVVRYRGRSVTVTVVDVCACAGRRLIDLTSGAFRRLAPLGHGVIPVTIEQAGASSTLPPTTTEETP